MKTVFQIKFTNFLFLVLFFSSFLSFAQTTTPFVKRYETTGINGDLTIIGNSIMGDSPDTPYNGDTQNNFIDMVFVDIDNNASTFNSSSAKFTTDACNRVVYAGLYWGAVSAPTSLEPEKVKFRIPGSGYKNITADTTIDWIYYKDVTSMVAGNSNVSGNYFVANISSSEGRSAAAGWSLVIVYEDPTESRKYISTFDGFSAVRDSPNNQVDFNYTGFVTPPSGPVEGRVGVAALEGDLGWFGDQMLFKADANAAFTALHDAENNVDNFFNSKITKDGVIVNDRNLNSTNTLGWDQKLLDLTALNSGNNLIGNNETGATVRVTNNIGGDWIYTFLNTFSINIIEPNLQVLTSVEDTSGNQITHNSPVPLGSTVWYNINFQNIGTDNAQNTYILNVLPINVTLDESSIVLPTGVTYTYNNATRELRFNIDNSLVERESLSTAHDIRYQVTASNDCFDYTDACTNLLENSITSYYDGETSGQNISGQPGLNGINGCGLGSVGSMDLFVDTSSCSFDSELFFCNNTLTFEGDDGYDTYIWTDEAGTVISNTKEVTVTGAGIYTATQRRTGCTETIRTVTVLGLDVTVTPSDVVCKDAVNGKVDITVNETSASFSYELYKGGNLIESKNGTSSNTHIFTNLDIGNYEVKSINADGCFDITKFSIAQPTLLEATSIKLYNATTCNGSVLNGSLQASASGGVPPYEFSIDNGNTYQTEDTFSVATEKTYEILVKDANGCITPTSVFVGFDQEIVYEINKEDVICVGDSDGRISVDLTNDQGYKVTYSLDGTNYQNNPNFTGLTLGSYELWVKKDNGFNVCETMNTIEIDQLVYLQLSADTDFSCEGSNSMIIAQVDPIYQNDVTFTLDGNTSNTSGIFENVSKGTHKVTVKHNEYGCSDEPVEVTVAEYVPISFEVQNTYINEYTIQASGGEPAYEYSMNSIDDFSSDNVFYIKRDGDYTFYVKDQRGCIAEITMFIEFLDIEIPDFFTPEGDGINDTWYPINIQPYPNISVKIFDRYQRLIASYKGLQYSWDGNYKGKALPSGDYWYFITLNEQSDNREYKGNFSLVR
ncbi:MAG: T9SS type B sorting domain-containing protein [Flavobacteriaceae bacterium]|nr:T9SS type B sorting domain-containing protein [Flavobacteriaceae bacterium]